MKSPLYKSFVLGFLFFVLRLCFSFPANGKFYNWVDANGVAHFSQDPPINSNQLEIKTYEEPKYPAGEMLENIPDLHKAAAMGNLEQVKALVANGISINSLSPGKGTALHFAASKGQLHVMEWLLENGSILDLKDKYNMTPLLFAVQNNHLREASFLISKGADVNAKNDEGASPLNRAAKNSNIEMVNLLVKNGADVNICDNENTTPLVIAVSGNQVEVVQLLLQNGANTETASNKSRWTALHYAAEKGYYEIVKLLLDFGAKVNSKDSNGNTPLKVIGTANPDWRSRTEEILRAYGGTK